MNTKTDYKKLIKLIVRAKVFQKLKETQSTHSKVSDICYDTFRTQEYINSHMLTNHEVTLLFSLRSRTMKSVRNNFRLKLDCPLGCSIVENQEHWLVCTHINGGKKHKFNTVICLGASRNRYKQLNCTLNLRRRGGSGPNRGLKAHQWRITLVPGLTLGRDLTYCASVQFV